LPIVPDASRLPQVLLSQRLAFTNERNAASVNSRLAALMDVVFKADGDAADDDLGRRRVLGKHS